MNSETIELRKAWNHASNGQCEDAVATKRDLLRRIAAADIADMEDAAFKMAVVISIMEEDDDRALAPEDAALIDMLQSIRTFLQRPATCSK